MFGINSARMKLMFIILLVVSLAECVPFENDINKTSQSNDLFNEQKIFPIKSNHEHANSRNNNDHDTVLVSFHEFVARVKGGLKQAQKIAKKFNLKFIRQVG